MSLSSQRFKSSTILTPLDIQIRATLLSSNKELQRAHRQLVMSGLLEEEEFWATRQHLLKAQELQLSQTKGMSSAFLADVRSSATEQQQQHGDVKYTLTPAIISSIFAQYPQIEALYKEHVPSSISVKDFWTLYFQSKFFLREKWTPNLAIKNNIFDKLDMEEQPLSSDNVNISPLINITRTVEDHEALDASDLNLKMGSKKLSVLRRFNKHSEIVLRSNIKQIQSNDTGGLADLLVIEDLKKDSDEKNIQPLNLTNMVFMSKIAKDISTTMDTTASSLDVSNWKPDILNIARNVEPVNFENLYHGLADVQTNLSWPIREIEPSQLLTFLLSLREILSQYFYIKTSSFLANEKSEKLSRLQTTLRSLRGKYEEMRERIVQDSDREWMDKCLEHAGLSTLSHLLLSE